MGNSIIQMLVISVFIEAVVQVIKPMFKSNLKLAKWDFISIGLGVAIALSMELNLLEGIVEANNEITLFFFRLFSGVALGRGPSFIHDLWRRLRFQYETPAPSTAAKNDTASSAPASDSHEV